MQAMYDQVVDCITKPPELRTDEEAEKLYPWFSKKSNLFADMEIETNGLGRYVVKDIIRNCSFIERPNDSVIIRQGDKGDCFYIILSGKVSIYINTEAVPDNPEEATVLVTEETFKEQSKTGETKKELDRTRYGKFIASIDAGKSFGELALINKDCIRNASIITDENTHLLKVDRQLYNRSLRAAQEAEFKARIDFVNNCSLFNKWQNRYRRQAAMSLRRETLQFSMNIVTQGEPTNGLTFIISGQAKVIVDTLSHNSQYPNLNLHEDPEDVENRLLIKDMLDQSTEGKPENKKLYEKPLRRLGYAVAEQRQAQKHLEICLVGPGETVGDIEQGMDLITYSQSLCCVEETFIFVLDAKNFDRLISTKRNPRTLHLLRKKAEEKMLSRIAMSQNKNVPLFRNLCYRCMERKQEEATAQQKDLLPDQSAATLRWNTPDKFIPTQGLLIDLAGPGTVFFRNKMKREAKMKKMQSKLQTQLERTGVRLQQPLPPGSAATLQLGTSFPNSRLQSRSQPRENIEENPESAGAGQVTSHTAKEDVDDWETSSEHLGGLESRLNSWHTVMKGSERRAKVPVVKLHRPQVEDVNRVFPGKKIYLRPRMSGHPDEANGEDHNDDRASPENDDTIYVTKPTMTQRVVTKPLSMLKSKSFFQESNSTLNEECSEESARRNSSDNTSSHPKGGKTHPEGSARKGSDSPAHNYTKDDYQKLKQLLKLKERQMEVFRSSIAL